MSSPLGNDTESITVRTAGLDEASLVREIMMAAYAEYKGVLPGDSGAHDETEDEVLSDMRKGGAVLAHCAEVAIGSARFRPEGSELYVGRLAVLPSYRRQGIGSAIMRFLEGIAAEHDCRAIRIGVRVSLPSNVGLYQSLGYKTTLVEPPPGSLRSPWRRLSV